MGDPVPVRFGSRVDEIATAADENKDLGFYPETSLDRELPVLLARLQEEIRGSHEDTAQVHLEIAQTERFVAELVSTVADKDAEIAMLQSDLARVRENEAKEPTAPAWSEANSLSRLGLELLVILLILGSAGVLGVVLSKWTAAHQQPESAGDTDAEEDPELQEISSAALDPTSAEILVEYKSLSTDPLLEANAYFDYGHYNKASELLSEIVHRHPDVAAYRLRLLRVLHAAGDMESFFRHASAFLDLLGDREDARWLEASRMGRELFPEADLFQSPFSPDENHQNIEKTVRTGTRADFSNADEANKAAVENVKYVDFLLIKDAGTEVEPGVDLRDEESTGQQPEAYSGDESGTVGR